MKTFFLALVILINFLPLYSQLYEENKDTVDFKFKFEFDVKYEKRATSSYFDRSGEVVTNIADTNYVFDEDIQLKLPDDFEREYGFDYNQHIIELGANYKVNDRSNLFVKIPISFYNLDEYYVTQNWYLDSSYITFNKSTRAEYKLTQIDYFEFAADYELFAGSFNLGFLAGIKIPAGFDKSMLNDGNYIFSDGALQIITGAEFGIKGKTTHFTVKPTYHYRAEEFADMFILNSKLTISSIKNTSLSIFLDYAEALDKDNSYEFNIREFPFQESYLDAGFGFWFVFNERFTGDFVYKIRMSGVETWQMNMFNAKLGYRL